MEKNSKPTKKFKKRVKRPIRKFRCALCERIVVKSEHIKVRKNYSHGKKSKPQITYVHRHDGGVLVELKRKKKNE
jgi:hypothetical protein